MTAAWGQGLREGTPATEMKLGGQRELSSAWKAALGGRPQEQAHRHQASGLGVRTGAGERGEHSRPQWGEEGLGRTELFCGWEVVASGRPPSLCGLRDTCPPGASLRDTKAPPPSLSGLTWA